MGWSYYLMLNYEVSQFVLVGLKLQLAWYWCVPRVLSHLSNIFMYNWHQNIGIFFNMRSWWGFYLKKIVYVRFVISAVCSRIFCCIYVYILWVLRSCWLCLKCMSYTWDKANNFRATEAKHQLSYLFSRCCVCVYFGFCF